MKKLSKIFITGLFVLLPVGLSIYIIVWLVGLLDGLLAKPIQSLTGFYFPGFGLIVLILLIFLAGLISSNIIGKKIVKFFQNILHKTPIIKNLYTPISDIIKTFSGTSKEKSFSKVVKIEFPMEGSYSIGFITNEEIVINEVKYSSVFIPTTPNPTNGFLILKKYDELEILDMSIQEGLNMIVSMSTTIKDEIKFTSK